MKKFIIPSVLFAVLFIAACKQNISNLPNGVWRAILQNDSTIDIPFNFLVYDSAGSKQIAFLNGEERLNINEVTVVGDSVFIKTPLYDTEIRALLKGNELSGKWIRRLPDQIQYMDFSAKANTEWRFAERHDETNFNLGGRWSVQITRAGSGDTTFAVGEFNQNLNSISGTFLTNTGDYRYLSGEMNRDNLFLSSYNGSVSTLFTGHFLDSNTIVNGKLYSGPTYVANWTANRDSVAMLSDPYSLTKLKSEETTIHFSFPDMDGNLVSLDNERFKNKVVVIQFLGSWCPNCMDETAFLSSFYEKYKDKGFEIIGLAYERYADREKAKIAVSHLIDRFKVKYPVLMPGFTNKSEEVLKSIPELASFSAFPTTIIINKKGEVSSIHTGFSGPATGQEYKDYIAQFEKKINVLLKD